MTLSRILPAQEMGLLREAQDILAEAWQRVSDSDRVCQEAYLKAKAEGYKAGLSEGIAQIERRVSDTLAKAERDLLDFEAGLSDIVLRALTLILGEMDADTRVRRIVATALSRAAASLTVSLRVAAEDEAFIRAAIVGLDPRLKVVVDRYVAPGEILLDVDGLRSQIGLADQLATLMEAINRG